MEARGGNDRVRTGSGNDTVDGVGGRDRIATGGGNDEIDVRDGHRDVVRCGPGTDRAVGDAGDRLIGCELMNEPPAGTRGRGVSTGAVPSDIRPPWPRRA